jgi:hypothetical protein
VSASVTPTSVLAGGNLSATVVTAGPVARVELYLGSGAPNAAAPVTYFLVESSAGTWTGTGTAPSVAGQYHFTVGLYPRGGKRIVLDNDAWNVAVSGGSGTSGAPPPLPADIPLAPPFSYGDPVAAVFNAAGQTVSGAEVDSTTRPDVPPASVADFYMTRLPRAGWTVDPSSAPPPGASSFSIYATSGNRVCIVEYSGYTIHLYYGSLAG